jgi:ferritin-like metal-binding protein YciE
MQIMKSPSQALGKNTPGKNAMPAKKTNHAAPAKDSKEAQGLRELFEDSLKDIYWAEKALVKAIPKMIKNATAEELRAALEHHLKVTKDQVIRLEQVFAAIEKPARAKKCDAMEGLIKEAEGIMEETEEGMVRDAGIIAAGQKVEHYEIATYGTLHAWAMVLGEEEVAAMLQDSLNEEKEADTALTEVAESSINLAAAGEHIELHENGVAQKKKKSK